MSLTLTTLLDWIGYIAIFFFIAGGYNILTAWTHKGIRQAKESAIEAAGERIGRRGEGGEGEESPTWWDKGLAGWRRARGGTPEEQAAQQAASRETSNVAGRVQRAAERAEEWEMREYEALKKAKQLLDSNDPKKVVQAAKMKREFGRILRRLNRRYNTCVDNIKKLEDLGALEKSKRKETLSDLKLSYNSLLKLLEGDYPKNAAKMIELLNDDGLLGNQAKLAQLKPLTDVQLRTKFTQEKPKISPKKLQEKIEEVRRSEPDPRKHPQANKLYGFLRNNLNEILNEAIKWDANMVKYSQAIEALVKQIQQQNP